MSKATEEKKICRKRGCGLIHKPSTLCRQAKKEHDADLAVTASHRLNCNSSCRVARGEMSFKLV